VNETRRTWRASVGLVALMFSIAFGGYVVAGEQVAVDAVEIVPGVTVTPAPGWEVAVREAGEFTLVRFTRGNGNVDVVAGGFAGDAAALLQAFRTQLLEPSAQQLRVSEQVEAVRHPSGLGGVRGFYVGVFGERSQSIEGEVTVFVAPSGVGVIFDAWAGEGALNTVLDDVHTMIESAELR
jgi:hypothetical protein